MRASEDSATDKDLIRRIRAAGIPIADDMGKAVRPTIRIRQENEIYEPEIFDLPGGAGLVLPLRILVEAPSFMFCDFKIRIDRFEGAHFDLLEQEGEWPNYDFKGLSERKFSTSEVINFHIAGQRLQRRGCLIRGLLLAWTTQPMPEQKEYSEILRGSIAIIDQFEKQYTAPILLRSFRERPRKLKDSITLKRRVRLFDRRDRAHDDL